MDSRRILITGLSSYWGGRLAQELETDERVEVVVGVDSEDPRVELQRTEFVRVGTQHALLRRIVKAARIDTVVDTRLVVDSGANPDQRRTHERNVMGTMNILAACAGDESPVKRFVFKSSTHYYGAERDDPAFFTEGMRRAHHPPTALEADIVDAERAVDAFADRNPDKAVCVLRFCNGLGPGLTTSHSRLLSLPAVPGILGFDPRYQFVHEDDIVGILGHAVEGGLRGTYNAAPDGVLSLSEVAGLLGKPYVPLLPPVATALVAGRLGALGLRFPPELLNQLRFGRAVDNRRLKATDYRFRYTSREAVLAFAQHLRTKGLRAPDAPGYRYEREVEDFLRRSPSVQPPALEVKVAAPAPDAPAQAPAKPVLAQFSPQELAELARVMQAFAERRAAKSAPSSD